MEWDWPLFPSKCQDFIEGREHSIRVETVEDRIKFDDDDLALWEYVFIAGCSLSILFTLVLIVWNILVVL